MTSSDNNIEQTGNSHMLHVPCCQIARVAGCSTRRARREPKKQDAPHAVLPRRQNCRMLHAPCCQSAKIAGCSTRRAGGQPKMQDAPRPRLPRHENCRMLHTPGWQGTKNAGCSKRRAGTRLGTRYFNESRDKSRPVPVTCQQKQPGTRGTR